VALECARIDFDIQYQLKHALWEHYSLYQGELSGSIRFQFKGDRHGKWPVVPSRPIGGKKRFWIVADAAKWKGNLA